MFEPFIELVFAERRPSSVAVWKLEDVIVGSDVFPASHVDEVLKTADRAEFALRIGLEWNLVQPLPVLDGFLEDHGDDDAFVGLLHLVPRQLANLTGSGWVGGHDVRGPQHGEVEDDAGGLKNFEYSC